MRTLLLSLHIAGGFLGLLSGTLAMALPKGSRGHRAAGNLFVISMLIMGAFGSTLAFRKHQTNNVFGGLLTVYMITTAWLTGRRRDVHTGALDWGAFVFGLSISASLLTLGTLVARGQAAASAGVPLAMYFFLGAIPPARRSRRPSYAPARWHLRKFTPGTSFVAHVLRIVYRYRIFLSRKAGVLPHCDSQAVPPCSIGNLAARFAGLLAFEGFVCQAS